VYSDGPVKGGFLPKGGTDVNVILGSQVLDDPIEGAEGGMDEAFTVVAWTIPKFEASRQNKIRIKKNLFASLCELKMFIAPFSQKFTLGGGDAAEDTKPKKICPYGT
jgi:hypothetical protein